MQRYYALTALFPVLSFNPYLFYKVLLQKEL